MLYQMPEGLRNLHIDKINSIDGYEVKDGFIFLYLYADGWYWSKGTEEEQRKDQAYNHPCDEIFFTNLKKHNIVSFDKIRGKKKDKLKW